MIIVTSAVDGRSASADSTANASATVLTKKAPVYNYAAGLMTWTVEVNTAGLSMTGVVFTDELPVGLTCVENALDTGTGILGASADVNGQPLKTTDFDPNTNSFTVQLIAGMLMC